MSNSTSKTSAAVSQFLSKTRGSGYGSGYGYGYGYGSGSGSGFGAGHGSGYGDGYGYGDGDGYGYGYGYGDGYGYGYGYGVSVINGFSVHLIDGVPTVIYKARGNLATGAILQPDLTLQPCFIAKIGDYFGHGETSRDAISAALAKALEDISDEGRIARFVSEFPSGNRYTGTDLFAAHGWLTGSCLLGREQFVKDREINLSATFSVPEFIALTKNAYGGEIIRQLEEHYS